MTNFDFFKKEEIFKTFSDSFIEAENSLRINTVITAIMSRRALELAVKWMYANDKELKIPYQDNISTLVHDITFRNVIDVGLFNQIKYIIKLGNFAVHDNRKIGREEAILSLNYLFNFAMWMQYSYGSSYENLKFDEKILSYPNKENVLVKEKKELYKELSKKDKKIAECRKESSELRNKITKNRENRELYYDFKINNISEKNTREMFIDLDLKSAGWDFNSNISTELELEGMPNNAGKGFADYVLFGDNGLPLAVVEAKKTKKDPRRGKEQAKLYADCIEKKYNQRPVIYYTNGLEIYMWDDVEYAPRIVLGFYTKDELQLLINRRKSKESLNHIRINDEITNREYQHEAVKSVCETFDEKHRKALLVMATGTGKTRTAISIVDVLTNKNWVKNILFLADRKVLVKQAKNNFVKLLPNMSTCNLLKNKENPEDCRIVFSTYKTMINEIDSRRASNGNRLFTPGHFDLIIIDEAHRSIYKKYQRIFEYFDALLVGLTATPRDDVDKNTYRFFEIENNVPTYTYEMVEAIKDGYLVDYHTIETNTKFIRDGIKYKELPEEEKEEFENMFEDEEFKDEINKDAINKWLFNRDTIKKVLNLLMERGLKVEGGDKLGKTIIFARNHEHAEKIVDIFNELYPKYKGEFAKVIDIKEEYNEAVFDSFSIVKNMPQIAISVDMLDTGVDIPEILNLVFFKPIKSKIKFWQMIGRGTRLCKDIFGIGDDKKEFYIFDICSNFEYFSENPKGVEANISFSLTEKIFIKKLNIITKLGNLKYNDNKEYKEYRDELVIEFLNEIDKINEESFLANGKRLYINKYNKKENWNYISSLDENDIKNNLIPIFSTIDDDEEAKRFDNIILNMQVKKLSDEKYNLEIKQIIQMCELLSKVTIPQVISKKQVILNVIETDYIKNASITELEQVRIQLRDLIKFLDRKYRKILYTDFEDKLLEVKEDRENIYSVNDFSYYRKKVSRFIQDNKENIIIYKLMHNEKLNKKEYSDLQKILFEELGTNDEYVKAFGNKNVMQVVRNIIGLDPEVAKEIFKNYTNDNMLNTKQIKFVKLLIDYVIHNGTVDLEVLMEDPFRSVGQIYDLFQDKINVITEIVNKIKLINENADKLA